MKTVALYTALVALLTTGCTTRELNTTADNVGRTVAYPVTAPVTAIANSAPLSTTTTYTYWKPVTGGYEPYTTDKPLTTDEQRALGLVTEKN